MQYSFVKIRVDSREEVNDGSIQELLACHFFRRKSALSFGQKSSSFVAAFFPRERMKDAFLPEAMGTAANESSAGGRAPESMRAVRADSGAPL